MLDQVLAVLAPRPGEIAVDSTLGLAGHAVAILRAIGPTGKLLGIDCDGEYLEQSRERLAAVGHPFEVRQANFAAIPRLLADAGIDGIDLLVADLGMSSLQLDDSERGFSYVRDGPLDMRLDRSRGRTAAELLATISEPELARALAKLGDEPNATRIARALVEARSHTPLQRCADVVQVVSQAIGLPVDRGRGWRLHPRPGRWNLHPAARTFQALRILLNRELGNLQELLRVLAHLLRPGGRAAIISFHSGEDRLVKAAFCEGLQARIYVEISPEPLRPTADEKLSNPRARSAKLRWARKAPKE